MQNLLSVLEILCQPGHVIQCAVPPNVGNPLSVSVQANGKKRPHFEFEQIKYEDWKVGIAYFELGAYMLTSSIWLSSYRGCNPSPMLPWFFVG